MEEASGSSNTLPSTLEASSSSKIPSRRDPERRTFIAKRAALRVFNRLKDKSKEDLCDKDRSSLEWARATLDNPDFVDPQSEGKSSAKEVPKRQRSGDETLSPANSAKRPKHKHVVGNRTYNEIARSPFMRAIIDRNAIDGALSHEKWDMVYECLLGVIYKVVRENPGPWPQNDDAGWYQNNIKLLLCSNERSAKLLELAVRSLGELWPGARLDAIPVCDIPRRPRSIGVFPAEPHDPATILNLLQLGNPGLPTHDWKVAKVSEVKNRKREVVVVLNKESLEPLRQRKGSVYYGFSSLRLNIYRGDDKADSESSVLKTEESPGDDLAASGETGMVGDDPSRSVPGEDPQSIKSEESPLRLDVGDDESDLLESQPEDDDVTLVNCYPDLDDVEDNTD